MPNQKILIVAPTAYPLGGVAVWLDYLLRGLSEKGYDLVFGAVNGRYHDSKKYLERYPFSKCLVIDNPSKTQFGRVAALKSAILSVNPALVLSVNIPDVYLASRELKASSHPNLKVLATLHGLLPRLFQDICTYSDCIDQVVVTNRLTELMVKQLTPFESSDIFYAAYGVKTIEPQKVINIESPIRLVYSGRIENEQKRCMDLVGIVKLLEDEKIAYVLRVAGDGPFKDELFALLGKIVRHGEVIDLGFVDEKQLFSDGYAKSDVLILTSDWETGPIVAWEAMSAGLVVVTSRYRGLESEAALVDNENCLVFDIGDVATAAEKIKSCLNQTVFKKLSLSGYELVQRRYSIEASLKSWASVFDQALSRQPQTKTIEEIGRVTHRYVRNGLVEKLFGVRLASKIRVLLSKPAYSKDAGDEWPHSHAPNDSSFNETFNKQLSAIEDS